MAVCVAGKDVSFFILLFLSFFVRDSSERFVNCRSLVTFELVI